MEEDIKVLENIINELEGETHYLLYTNKEKVQAIENIIAENKKLKGDLYATNCIVNEQIDLLRDSISKSKIEEEFEREMAHNNCFNLGDMQDLLDRILD